MSVQIGINPLTWTNDDMPWLGAEVPLEICLREARAAGYTGIELGNKFPRSAERLGPILRDADLKLVSGWHSVKLLERSVDEEIESIKPHLELLASQGSSVVILAEVSGSIHGDRGIPCSRRPRIAAKHWDAFCDRLTRLAEFCAGQGLSTAYHHHMGTVIQSEEDIGLADDGDRQRTRSAVGHRSYHFRRRRLPACNR